VTTRRAGLLTLLALLLILAAVAFAQVQAERRRGLGESTTTIASPILPLQGVDIQKIDWSQILAMLGVLAIVSGGFQWLIAKTIVQPQIEKSINGASDRIMESCLAQFTSKYAFREHELEESAKHQATGESIEQIVKNQDQDHERLSVLRDRVLAIELRPK
jgi:hypothetical protein